MRRVILLGLAFIILFMTSACGQNDNPIESPVNMYFLNKNVEYGVESGLISAEVQEGAHLDGDVYALITQYLKGPNSANWTRAIPAGVSVEKVDISGNTVIVTMSHDFNRLNGVDLSIASACLAMTIFDFADVQWVRLQANSTSLGDNDALLFGRDDMLLYDTLINTTD